MEVETFGVEMLTGPSMSSQLEVLRGIYFEIDDSAVVCVLRRYRVLVIFTSHIY